MDNFDPQVAAISAALHSASRILPSSDFDLNNDGQKIEPSKLRPAAVLVPIFFGKQGLEVIFTKRAAALRHHPGQISFPGGKKDETDQTLEITALREANEEVGLDPNSVHILGQLPQHSTVTSFLVSPFVAMVPSDFRPCLQTDEVAEVFSVPLIHLLDRENYQIEGRIWLGKKRRYYAVPYGPYYIWGATARMLRMLAEIAGTRNAD